MRSGAAGRAVATAVAVVALVATVGCAGDDGATAGADAPVPTAGGRSPGATASPPPPAGTAPGDTSAGVATTTVPGPPTTVVVPALTTASTILPAACSTSWSQVDAPVEPVPEDLRLRLGRALGDPRLATVTLGASVWVEGYGEVVAVRPDELLVPASNQKLVTVVGALEHLSPYAVPLPELAPGQATWQLVHAMLGLSDNTRTDALLAVVGQASGGQPTLAGGLAAAHAAAERLCAPLDGTSADGSGLSRQNRHSARSLRHLLQAVLPSPIGYTVSAGLAVGGGSGTLVMRFVGTPAQGNVRAKTGSLNGVVALTGHLTTAGGRLVVFSLLANDAGPTAEAQAETTQAIDDLVVALAADTS